MEIKHNILVLLFINLSSLIVLVLLYTQEYGKTVWANNVLLEAFTFLWIYFHQRSLRL